MQAHPPEVVLRTFYGPKDRSLGEFLLRYCFNQDVGALAATREAGRAGMRAMADGDFAFLFIHGDGRIRLSAERLSRSDQADMLALLASTPKVRVWHQRSQPN
jgi:hypothetical protein